MTGRLFIRVTTLGGLAVGSFFAGSYLERKKVIAQLQNSLNIDNRLSEELLSGPQRPGLPLFGTVSAATPMPPPVATSSPGRVRPLFSYVNPAHGLPEDSDR